MAKNKLLVVDELASSELKIENGITLYPTFENEVPWSITIDEYFVLNKCVNSLIDDTTEYLVNLPILPINSSAEALRKLIRPNTAQILYILIERLVRILKFISLNDISNISLIKTRTFLPPSNKRELYALARDSWEFNQSIINEILSECNKVNITEKEVLYPEDSWDFKKWYFYKGYENNEPIKRKSFARRILTFSKNPGNVFLSKIYPILHSKILKLSSHGKLIPTMGLSYSEEQFLNHGFFWPMGKFCQLPQCLPHVSSNREKFDSAFRTNLATATQNYFEESAFNLLKQLGITISGIKNYLKPLSRLFFQYYPINMLENYEGYCNWSIKQFRSFKIKHYFTWDTASTDLAIFYNYAATELGFKVWGMQHSARGGYVANAPSVAELLISGSDFYITSGWSHSEPHLPMWRYSAIPMSSPHYSAIKIKKRLPKMGKTVLLAIGEIYRFSVIYDGSYYIDTAKVWAKTIEDIIQCLVDKDVEIILKLYSPIVSGLLRSTIYKWLKTGGANIRIASDGKGSAKLLFNKVSATIWDMPAGGFVESILDGTPAFAIWRNDLMRYQPEAKEVIIKLIEEGVLNATGMDMANNVTDCVEQNDWWKNPERKQAVDEFMKRFIKTSHSWKRDWKSFLNELDNFDSEFTLNTSDI